MSRITISVTRWLQRFFCWGIGFTPQYAHICDINSCYKRTVDFFLVYLRILKSLFHCLPVLVLFRIVVSVSLFFF